MRRRHMHRSLLAIVLLVLTAGALPAQERPNILFIVADDLGIETLQSYGGRSYDTPNLDRLARQGMRFTHAFSNPLCTPSRAQILTGRYPMHNGMERVIFNPDKHREYLDPERETTFAKLLNEQGYATAMAGKWQLSFLHERDLVRDHGFDEYQCWQIFLDGKKTSRYLDPVYRRNGTVLDEELDGRYGPDVNVEFLIDFMKRHRDDDAPFVAYYTALLPHWPWVPTPDSEEELHVPETRLGNSRYYPDMVKYLDTLVGRLLRALKKLGVRDNTLVIFTGDNGTDRRITSRWEHDGTVHSVPGGKGTMTDRGTRVPLLVRWPGVVPEGEVNHDLIDFSDFLPTLAEVAKVEVPTSIQVDGRSFAPQLRGDPGNPRSWIHVQDQGKRYVRNRDYIFTNNGALRPVLDLHKTPADSITPPLTDEQNAVRDQLHTALNDVEPMRGSLSADDFSGTVLDDRDAKTKGNWTMNNATEPYLGSGYHHDENEGKREKEMVFEADLSPGKYEVRLSYTTHGNRAENVPVEIHHAGGTETVFVNQKKIATVKKVFEPLAKVRFDGTSRVVVKTTGTSGYVVVDGVQFVPVDE